ncbi:PEPxxWA-CTERM sorting domain-containing protein [Sphingomonas endophytica]|uniref:PEP-CTERM protein-sorting domain-containing protein n=1 Tax=Sphingomonas endophytica TaxID=869719 RepID=A0A147HWR2_9SPHN|nr:PEPxxWA-CTERM sorting domain-containing protein [Sphingomonas endophytica]KTT69376.1 hypothetical protein NS334_14820 [Sphingomonas endophytica]
MKKYLLAAAAVMLVSGTASAQSVNMVKNGQFETSTVNGNRQFTNEVANWTNAATNGWTGYGYNFLIQNDNPDGTGFTSLRGNHDYLYGTYGSAANTSTGAAGTFVNNYSATGFNGGVGMGNYVLMDGDTNFHGALSQQVTGLTVGQLYSVTFDWAGASWFTIPGQTTQRFDVSLDGVTKSTDTLTTAPKGFSGWQKGSLQFTATSTSQKLSFLAQGTPNGLPPSLLLDNVQMAAVPEPATWLTMILGFGVVGAAMRRRKVARPQLV